MHGINWSYLLFHYKDLCYCDLYYIFFLLFEILVFDVIVICSSMTNNLCFFLSCCTCSIQHMCTVFTISRADCSPVMHWTRWRAETRQHYHSWNNYYALRANWQPPTEYFQAQCKMILRKYAQKPGCLYYTQVPIRATVIIKKIKKNSLRKITQYVVVYFSRITKTEGR